MAKTKTTENILEKGFPTRDDLNGKIEREAKRAFESASEDDLTSLHSEAEIKCQLRNALRDTSMTDEMIQALYIKDDVLGDAYRFFTEESKDNQVFLAMYEYLEKAEHDYLAGKVFDRAKLEYGDYIDSVREMPADKVIEEAYKITALHDIHISLDPGTSKFSTEQLRALHSLASPLWSLYDEWMRRDVSHMDGIKEVIYDVADETVIENNKNKYVIDPDPFGLDDENEDGQEP